MAKKKDFEDERVEEKKNKLSKKSKKALKRAKKEVQKKLDEHKLGWKTRDGKEF